MKTEFCTSFHLLRIPKNIRLSIKDKPNAVIQLPNQRTSVGEAGRRISSMHKQRRLVYSPPFVLVTCQWDKCLWSNQTIAFLRCSLVPSLLLLHAPLPSLCCGARLSRAFEYFKRTCILRSP